MSEDIADAVRTIKEILADYPHGPLTTPVGELIRLANAAIILANHMEAGAKRRSWSDDEDNTLLALMHDEAESLQSIAVKMNRSLGAIQSRAKILRLVEDKKRNG